MAAVAVARVTGRRFFPHLFNQFRAGAYKQNLQTRRQLHFTRYLLGVKKYTEKHEWISVDDGVGTVGVSNHAQEALGEIVYVELPEIGLEVEQNGECAVLESVKAASDIYAPASGEVVEVNKTLEEDAELINRSAEDEGWMFKIKLSDPDEVNNLMSSDEYLEFIETHQED